MTGTKWTERGGAERVSTAAAEIPNGRWAREFWAVVPLGRALVPRRCRHGGAGRQQSKLDMSVLLYGRGQSSNPSVNGSLVDTARKG
jgi:hypothetical protein